MRLQHIYMVYCSLYIVYRAACQFTMLIMQCVVYNVKPVEPHAALVPVPVVVVKLTYWSGQYLVVECCEYTISPEKSPACCSPG